MNVAIMMWTLATGGVAIPTLAAPTAQPEAPIYRSPTTGPGAPTMGSTPSSYPSLDRQPSLGNRGGGSLAEMGTQPPLMPFAPTDPSAAYEAFPGGPSTAYSGPGGSGFVQPPTPGAGSYGRPALTSPGASGSFSRQPAAPTMNAFDRAANRLLQEPMAKPHSEYRPPRAYSPYMELFRVDRSDGIDNYNQYVKPQLDAQKARQQTRNDIRRLQGSSRAQGSAIRNLGRQSQALQGNSVPQYYQNYGNYYPGLGR